MPLYEYDCLKCGNEFEKLVTSATVKTACPDCGGRRVQKKFSVFGSKSGGKFTSSVAGGDCSSCAATSCKSCKTQ